MNYCDKIKYKIYSVIVEKPFPEMVDDVLSQIADSGHILRLVFFGSPRGNEEYVTQRDKITEKAKDLYGDKCPAISYVAQPPLNSSLTLEVQSIASDAGDTLIYKKRKNISYVLLENNDCRILYAGGIQGDVINKSIEEQGVEVFEQLGELLNKEKFPIDSIVRQWNYIERITDFDGKDQNYQTFNNARNDLYELVSWKDGYPAATGIGADFGGILIDVEAIVLSSHKSQIIPLDNRLQVAAHAYSENVLFEAQSRRATPKFERAKKLLVNNRELIYVSGTAAIRGENSLEGIGLEKQLHITMENIAVLIDGAAPVLLRVYLKDKSLINETQTLMSSYGKDIPVMYTVADVCRDELLIEIEGIAIK